MPRRSPAARRFQMQGQILLERALFCVGCEVIFTGTVHCPRCAGHTVWPLAEWLGSARPSIATAEPLPSSVEQSSSTRGQRTPSAA